MSDVDELTSTLKLVVHDNSSADAEMKFSSLTNVGWAAEIVDNWNAVDSHSTAVKLHSSTYQSAQTGSSLLQCGTFCTCYNVIMLLLMIMFFSEYFAVGLFIFGLGTDPISLLFLVLFGALLFHIGSG